MKRHRDGDVCSVEDRTTPSADATRQGLRQGSAPFIFERVNDVTKRAVVEADGLRVGNRGRNSEHAGDRRVHGTPADAAHWAARRLFEDFAAGGARRVERDGEDRVD